MCASLKWKQLLFYLTNVHNNSYIYIFGHWTRQGITVTGIPETIIATNNMTTHITYRLQVQLRTYITYIYIYTIGEAWQFVQRWNPSCHQVCQGIVECFTWTQTPNDKKTKMNELTLAKSINPKGLLQELLPRYQMAVSRKIVFTGIEFQLQQAMFNDWIRFVVPGLWVHCNVIHLCIYHWACTRYH